MIDLKGVVNSIDLIVGMVHGRVGELLKYAIFSLQLMKLEVEGHECE